MILKSPEFILFRDVIIGLLALKALFWVIGLIIGPEMLKVAEPFEIRGISFGKVPFGQALYLMLIFIHTWAYIRRRRKRSDAHSLSLTFA